MRTVTKQQVIEAADEATQVGEYIYGYGSMHLNGWDKACDELTLAARSHAFSLLPPGDCGRSVDGCWWLTSSILYAAALEGGPMPPGWAVVP